MADITFVVAPIGGGKSLYATRAICLELQRSDRMIVTNVPVFFDTAVDGSLTLQEWCQKYVERPIDVRKRVRCLTREEMFEFWRYLPGAVMPNIEQSSAGGGTEIVPDLQWRLDKQREAEMPNGCFFVLDEVHLYFSARDWTKLGNKVEAYMSQLRKLNDDLFLITQHPEKVDKNFRRNATEWLYMENMGRKRLFMGVSLPRRFRYHIFPQMPVRNDKPSQSGWMQLEDKEFQKCYDTMAGVGLSGKLAPESSRTKGRHWSVWVLALLVLFVACWFLPRFIMNAAGKVASNFVSSFQHGVQSKVLGDKKPVVPVPVKSPVAVSDSVVTPVVSAVPANQVIGSRRESSPVVSTNNMTGFVGLPDGLYVICFADGSRITSNDRRIQMFNKDFILVDGTVHYMEGVLGAAPARERPKYVEPPSVPASVQSSPEGPERVYSVRVAPAYVWDSETGKTR